MKKYILTTVLSSWILMLSAQTLTIDITGSVVASKPYEGINASGSYGIVYGAGSSSVTKPIIIVEGWDPFNEMNFYTYYNDLDMYFNLFNDLHNNGYDIIFLNFDASGDFIQRNAYLVVKLIQEINTMKQSAGSSEYNSVMGFSMGGVIARYALAYMESQNMDHETINFISHDSPQMGANVPLSLQLIGFDGPWWLVALNAMATFMNDNPATKQVMFYELTETIESSNFTPSPGEFFDSFQGDIQSLNPTNYGFPSETKNIGLSNGSKTLQRQTSISGGRLSPGDDIIVIDALVDLAGNHYVPYTVISKAGYGNWVEFDGNNTNNFSGSHRGYDVISGSFERAFQIDVMDFEDHVPFVGFNEFTLEPFSFIPTLSALHIGFDDPWAVEGQDITVALCHTPFDVVFAEDDNSPHVQLSTDASDFILDEMISTAPMFVDTEQISIGNTTITTNKEYEAVNIEFDPNVTINSGVQVEASSGSFRIDGPFNAKLGSVLQINGGGNKNWILRDASCYVAPTN